MTNDGPEIATTEMRPEADARFQLGRPDLLEYANVVRRTARKYRHWCSNGMDQEDLEQEGFIGLIRACETYTSGSQISFDHHAARCIKTSILMAVKRNGFLIKTPPGVRSPKIIDRGRRDEGKDDLLYILAIDKNVYSSEITVGSDVVARIYAAIDALPEMSARVLKMLFGIDCEPRTLAEIAEIVGWSYDRVVRTKFVAMIELKSAILSDKNFSGNYINQTSDYLNRHRTHCIGCGSKIIQGRCTNPLCYCSLNGMTPHRNMKGNGSSRYRGVTFKKGRKLNPWQAQISGSKGKMMFIGGYATEEEAARAYDVVAKKLDRLDKLNFPDE